MNAHPTSGEPEASAKPAETAMPTASARPAETAAPPALAPSEAFSAVTLDIHQVLKLLPHRYPFLLVDRVLHIEKGKHITALKNVTINEPFFNGHFPNRPVMPGVLMLEAMAQAAALLSFHSRGIAPDANTVYYFAAIDGARFKRVVEPGDQLTLEVSIDRMKADISKFKGRALVGTELACEASLMCAMRRVE